jgi:hypothetical protein
MNQTLLQKDKRELTTKEKLLVIAETLRNNQGVTQIRGCLNNGNPNHFCAMGLLGFRSGMSYDSLRPDCVKTYDQIAKNYGFSSLIDLTKNLGFLIIEKNDGIPIFESNQRVNTHTFDEIADLVEEKANSL